MVHLLLAVGGLGLAAAGVALAAPVGGLRLLGVDLLARLGLALLGLGLWSLDRRRCGRVCRKVIALTVLQAHGVRVTGYPRLVGLFAVVTNTLPVVGDGYVALAVRLGVSERQASGVCTTCSVCRRGAALANVAGHWALPSTWGV